MKKYIISSLSCFLILIYHNCYGEVNFSTPENTYKSYHEFISEKNLEGFYSCFFLGEIYSKENLTVLAEKFFHEVRFENCKILKKRGISDDRIEIIVEEIMVFLTHGNTKAKSKVLIEFKKVANEWKIFKTKSLDTNKIEPKNGS